MKTIYLAGACEAYSGTNKAKAWRDEARDWFEAYSEMEVISPVDYYTYEENYHKTDAEIMRFDLRKVKECDVVLVNLDSIRQSLGTSDEILYAYMINKPIVGFLETERELNNEEIVQRIHAWKFCQIDRIETDVDAMYKAMQYIAEYYR